MKKIIKKKLKKFDFFFTRYSQLLPVLLVKYPMPHVGAFYSILHNIFLLNKFQHFFISFTATYSTGEQQR